MSCWLLCDQYFEMCQSRICKGALDDITNDQNRLKQLCGLGSVETGPGGTVAVNRSNRISGLCSERKKAPSCLSLDCCEPIEVQNGRVNGRNRCLLRGGGGGRVLEEKNAGKQFGKSLKSKERALEFLDLSGCFLITDAGLR